MVNKFYFKNIYNVFWIVFGVFYFKYKVDINYVKIIFSLVFYCFILIKNVDKMYYLFLKGIIIFCIELCINYI